LENWIVFLHRRPAERHSLNNLGTVLPMPFFEVPGVNQIKVPQWGQGASPGGKEGSTRISEPQSGQRLGRPSGVRDAIIISPSYFYRGTLSTWPAVVQTPGKYYLVCRKASEAREAETAAAVPVNLVAPYGSNAKTTTKIAVEVWDWEIQNDRTA
jgi:hypothetical protein